MQVEILHRFIQINSKSKLNLFLKLNIVGNASSKNYKETRAYNKV